MSLTERFFPIVRRQDRFFEPFMGFMEDDFRRMQREMMSMHEHMAHEMQRMRSQMFQLEPCEPSGNVVSELQPRHPIVEEKGESKLKLDFNMKGFKPDEVKVKLLGDHILQVSAKSDVKTDNGESHHTYLRQYTLPEGVQTDKITPRLSDDGVLTIEAPAPHLKEAEKMIPIQYHKSK